MLKLNKKQSVKAMKMLRRTYPPLLISDVAMQGNRQGMLLRAEVKARKNDGFRRSSYPKGEPGLSGRLQQAYSTSKEESS